MTKAIEQIEEETEFSGYVVVNLSNHLSGGRHYICDEAGVVFDTLGDAVEARWLAQQENPDTLMHVFGVVPLHPEILARYYKEVAKEMTDG